MDCEQHSGRNLGPNLEPPHQPWGAGVQRPQERAMLLCFVEALPLQPVQPAVSIRVCRAHSQGPLLIPSKLWRGIGRHIPSHCSVAELSLRVAWSRSLAAEWIAGTRGKGRWTEFRLWVQTSSSLKPTSLLPKPCSEKPCENKVSG